MLHKILTLLKSMMIIVIPFFLELDFQFFIPQYFTENQWLK